MKILFFVTEDWYFCSHRLHLADAAARIGHEVVVVTRVREHGGLIEQAGLRVVAFANRRGSINPLAELWTLARLTRIYRRERPDLTHHVAIKPVLYGSIAASIARVPNVVNALAGLGWIFSSDAFAARVLKRFIRPLLGRLMRRGVVIVQNADDEAVIRSLWIDDVRTIRGSGVDPDKFFPTGESEGMPVIILVSRLLFGKGIQEFADAARLLKARGVAVRCVLVGASDPDNPSSVPSSRVDAWVSEGILEWWGRRDDMVDVLAQATIACLPSYREGLPKSLLEAAACGLPIVTTDVPGCRDVVRDGDNGLLVPARDAEALAVALERLGADEQLRKRMGERGRTMVLEQFTEAHVAAATLRVYQELDQRACDQDASYAKRR